MNKNELEKLNPISKPATKRSKEVESSREDAGHWYHGSSVVPQSSITGMSD